MNEVTSRVIQVASGQTGRSFWGPGDMYTFLVTGEESGGSMFALDCVVGSGGGPPPHKHLAEDELFAITSGSITFTAESETRTVSAGDSSSPTIRRAAAAPNWYIGTLTVVMSEKRASRVSVIPATETRAGTSIRRTCASSDTRASMSAP